MPVRRYGLFDAAGLPTGFWSDDCYPDDVTYGPDPNFTAPPVGEGEGGAETAPVVELSRGRNSHIPAAAVPITDEQWMELLKYPGARRWDVATSAVVAYVPVPPTPSVPDSVSLQEWRSGLDLWMRDDGTGTGAKVSRLSDVYSAIKPLTDAGNPLGKVAMQQLEYANNVELSQLLKIRQAFGFSEAECQASMWRALDVRNGIYDGRAPANS